jgi:hypothetical protein
MLHRYIFVSISIFSCCFLLYYLQMRLPFQMVSLFYQSSQIDKSIRHNAIILARRPSVKILKHLNVLVNAGVNAFVMCDEQPSKYTNLTDRILYIHDERLARYGLSRNLVWDRAFVWLYNQSSIDYVWLMEDDVTWSSVDHMVNLFNKYAKNPADLLSRDIIYRSNQTL